MNTRSLKMDDDKTKPDSQSLPMTGPLDAGAHDTFILGKNLSLRSPKRLKKLLNQIIKNLEFQSKVCGIKESLFYIL